MNHEESTKAVSLGGSLRSNAGQVIGLIVLGVTLALLPACTNVENANPISGEPTAIPDESAPESPLKQVVYEGRTWWCVGPARDTGDIFRPSMSAMEYTTGEEGTRLLELTNRNDPALVEGVFSRILRIQVMQEGRWVSHGRESDWEINGARGEIEYRNGEPHGLQRKWYSNGQLHIERQWINGKMEGPDRGWYESGKPQYDAFNVDDKEVYGKCWDENGAEL